MGERIGVIKLIEHVERAALWKKYTEHSLRQTIARDGARWMPLDGKEDPH